MMSVSAMLSMGVLGVWVEVVPWNYILSRGKP